MGKTDPRQIQAMREYLRERFGITTNQELAQRVREAPRIDLSIFTRYGPADNWGQKEGQQNV